MALSSKARKVLEIALASRPIAAEVADAIDSGSNAAAAEVTKIGVTADLVGVDGVGSNAAPLAETEDRLDAIEAKIDELIQALQDAGLME